MCVVLCAFSSLLYIFTGAFPYLGLDYIVAACTKYTTALSCPDGDLQDLTALVERNCQALS